MIQSALTRHRFYGGGEWLIRGCCSCHRLSLDALFRVLRGLCEKVLDAGVYTIVCCVVMVVKYLWHNQLDTQCLCVVIGCEYA